MWDSAMNIDDNVPMPRLITVKDVMSITSLSRSSVYNLIAAGEFRPIKVMGKTVFAEAHIAGWINDKITQAA
jgi:predicted DNA-binding transcriptional regulator AlpA